MDFIAELLVSGDRRTWRGDEVAELTASALHPVPDSEPGFAVSAVKIGGEAGPDRYADLVPADWQALHEAWTQAGLPQPGAPMTEDEWMPYVLAFNESKDRPAWEFGIIPPVDPHRATRLSLAATREEHAALLKEAIADGAVVAINPLTGARAYALSRLEAVALRRDGLAQFCAMVSIRLVTTLEASAEPELPRFVIPVRPLIVPGALQALNSDKSVRYDHGASCGITGSGVQSAADLVAEFERVIARQRLGAFLPDEAAHLIAEKQDFDSKSFRQRLEEAYRAGELIVRAPDTELPRKPSESWRPHSDIVMVDDLNAWLGAQGVGYRFPSSPTAPHAKAAGQGPGEAGPCPKVPRFDDLRDVIEKVAKPDEDRHAAWRRLQELAKSEDRPAPLVGLSKEGVKWRKVNRQTSDEKVVVLNRDAFYGRWATVKDRRQA